MEIITQENKEQLLVFDVCYVITCCIVTERPFILWAPYCTYPENPHIAHQLDINGFVR